MHAHLHTTFVQALMKVNSTDDFQGRTALMAGIPGHIVGSLSRSAASRYIDLSNLVPQLAGLGRLLDTGERPLLIVAQNALMQVDGTTLGEELKRIIKEIEDFYGGNEPSNDIPAVPEILIFEERDERLPFSFVQNALAASRSVARLYVPRIVHGKREVLGGVGTGWLITPDLMLTNHHVINARLPGESPANALDFQAQGEQTLVWFDYHLEGGSHIDYEGTELVHSNPKLDYALFRLVKAMEKREHLPLIHQKPKLETSTRLNIVQHPGGGPMRFAIRNNFYVGEASGSNRIRYVTDTEPGSSGSPVLNDRWHVIAMHRGYQEIPEEMHKGKLIRYHNEGIAIHAILEDLPLSIGEEIKVAQEWS